MLTAVAVHSGCVSHLSNVLRYAGFAFELAGLLLAAKGIGDVRREWTQLPGIWGHTKALATRFVGALIRKFWAAWNRLAPRIGLPPHRKDVSVSGGVAVGIGVSGSATVLRAPPPTAGTVEERLAWLEERLTQTRKSVDEMRDQFQLEADARKSGDDAERAAWSEAVARTRERLSDLAAGGLRLQTLGVVLLFIGLIFAAIPRELAQFLC